MWARPCARAVPPAAYGRFLATTRYEGFVAMLPGPVGDRCERWQLFSAKELVAASPPSVQPVDIALTSTNYHVRPDEGRGYYSVSKLDVVRDLKWSRPKGPRAGTVGLARRSRLLVRRRALRSRVACGRELGGVLPIIRLRRLDALVLL